MRLTPGVPLKDAERAVAVGKTTGPVVGSRTKLVTCRTFFLSCRSFSFPLTFKSWDDTACCFLLCSMVIAFFLMNSSKWLLMNP